MIGSKPPGNPELYLDFSQFDKLRKLNQSDEDAALQATAKQMESVFLNMMLQSMRQANTVFSEGGMFESKESQFYQGMYDKQLTSNIANGNGIGLADVIVKQLSTQKSDPSMPSQKTFPIESYMQSKMPAVYVRKAGPAATVAEENTQVAKQPELEALSWHSPQEFVEAIYPYAEKAAAELGIGAEAIIAQAVLETGWGQHVMEKSKGVSSHNFFGIKADSRWNGDATQKDTLEYRNGIAAKEVASFRSYASLDEAFEDYVAFLKNNPRYESAVGKNIETKQWGYQLQKSGYATDPKYGNKIADIMESDVLQSVLTKTSKKI